MEYRCACNGVHPHFDKLIATQGCPYIVSFPYRLLNAVINCGILPAMKISIVILLLFSGLYLSCKDEKTTFDIDLPATSVLSVQSRWSVINSTHLRLREKPDINSKAITTLWKGYVLEVVSQSSIRETLENLDGYWYQVKYGGLQGWVFGAYLKFFDTKDHAERSSREIKG